ncbi:NYN domain-containing protein [Nocardia beijingensis]
MFSHQNCADCLSRPITPPEIAVLIEAENITATRIGEVPTRVGDYGSRQIRRALGDWRRPSLTARQHLLLTYAIRPVQQFSWTTGKNACDLALATDAMDLLASGISWSALVSSDSDFTGLPMRLREPGCDVYGFGENKTPRSCTACTAFISLQDLSDNAPIQPCPPATDNSHHPRPGRKAGIRTATDARVSAISAEQLQRLCALVKKAAQGGRLDRPGNRRPPHYRPPTATPQPDPGTGQTGTVPRSNRLFDIEHSSIPGGKPPKISIRCKIRH